VSPYQQWMERWAERDKDPGRQAPKPVTTQIDVGALENLASQTGGTYIQLVAGKPLDIHWASTLAGSHTEKHESQVYQYPLGLAMLLVFGLFVRGLLPSRQKRN